MSFDLALAASQCPVVVAAVRLSEWVGEEGVPVTAAGSLRPADVPDAALALGIVRRAKVRRAADVPQVHRPWLAAIGIGLITVGDQRAVRSGKLEDPLGAWWAGLRTLLTAEVTDIYDIDPRITALATLTVVTQELLSERWRFQHRVEQVMVDRGDWDSFGRPQRHASAHPAEAALDLLRLFGVLDGTKLTPLGSWAHAELQGVVPPQITPQMPAKDLLAQLAGRDRVDAGNRAGRWFGDRSPEQIAAELVAVAADATPAERMIVVELIGGLGEDAVAACRGTETSATMAPHLRSLAYQFGQAPAPGADDVVWLATEYAHADLACHDVSDAATARYTAMETLAAADLELNAGGLDRIAACGHPYAADVAATLTDVAGAPIPVQQLKISLTRACWRRVLLPENATLGLLHRVIQMLFGWDGDHLHIFSVGHRHYADRFHWLEETVDEDSIRLHQALPHPKATLRYTYDLGATWRHEILLEKILDQQLTHPECESGRGDNPIEYYDPDDPEDPEPFDPDAINNRLRRLAGAGR
ncbi:MAG: hypothetical protein GEU86_16005 [Actinophytocola sp.]|nr:hypothetical protein [Actinophytocola sp.]